MVGHRARFIDQRHLRGEAYVDPSNLEARGSIYRFAEPRIPFHEWALSHIDGDLGSVLDVGCGPGTYLRPAAARDCAQLVGLDLSEGMLRQAAAVGVVVAGDAQALPLRSDSFDTTLCMHMLYHVANIDGAVAELRRVTKPGGVVLVTTNGGDHHRRLRELFDEAISSLAGTSMEPVLSTSRGFRLEEGEPILRRQFDSVTRYDLKRELVLPDPEPVLEYLGSIRSFHEERLPADVPWDAVVGEVASRISVEIDRAGAFRSPIHGGLFVCT